MHTALLHGLPVVLLIALVAFIYSRTGRRIAPYRLSQPWTHEPILWSAVEETIPSGHGHGHGEPALSVGGGASGSW